MAANINLNIIPSEYKVLIVDDVVSNTMLIKAVLKQEGYTILTADSGPAALEVVANQSPDVILLDVMMPGMDGFEVCTRLKMSEATSNIPIIFLTALINTDDVVKGFKLGASDYIGKPFKQDELKIRVRNQINLVATTRIIMTQQDELIKTIKGRDRLYSVIAHDLRGPVGMLKMMLNTLVFNYSNEELGDDRYEMLNLANKTTENLFDLLNNLLQWTKSQLGRLNTVRQNHDIVSIVRDGIEITSAVASLKDISITTELPDAAINVYADIDMIKTVVRNIIGNAIKFSNKGGVIDVSLTEDDDYVTVSIQDHGKGIKAADQDKLLKPDTHFSTFGTNNEEGSGLGLLLCQDFVMKNSGSLWFESEEGMGSTFHFSVPKHQITL